MSGKNHGSPVSRRKFLGITGVSGLGFAMPGVAGAKSSDFDPDKAYEQALQISEEAEEGNQEALRDILRDTTEFEVFTNDDTQPTPPPNEPGPSPEFVYPADVNTWMTGTRWEDVVFAHFHFDVEYTFNDGDPPFDPCALGWEAREYDYLKHYTSNYTDYGHFNTRGAWFEYHDEADDCHCQKKNRNVGVKLRKEGGTPQSRRVIGSLWHTYHRTSIDSVGIGADGVVSVSLANETKKWDHPVQTYIDEK